MRAVRFFVALCVTSQTCVPERVLGCQYQHILANGVKSATRTMHASQNHGAPRLAGRTRAAKKWTGQQFPTETKMARGP